MGAAYQVALSAGGLIAWVHSDNRGSSLLSQNKEGFCSAFGYWALYMASVGVADLALRWAGADGGAGGGTSGGTSGGARCGRYFPPLFFFEGQWPFGRWAARDGLLQAVI